MKACKLCGRPDLDVRLDFGPQAITNRFLRAPDEPQDAHPLDLGVCAACGTVQLASLTPPDQIRPRFDWLSYNEPERHLDDVVRLVRGLPGLRPSSLVLGLTYKDASTLERLGRIGFDRVRLADRAADLGIEHPLGGIESVQQRLTPETAARLADRYGRPELVVLRHVLEHAHDVRAVLECLRRLVAPGGHVVVECPDAVRALECCDYSTVWEEHVFSFTPATLRQCFALAGFEVVSLRSHLYSHENSLVVVARPSTAPQPTLTPQQVGVETSRLGRFADRYPEVRAAHAALLERQGRSALLGAGHLSAAFVNLLGLGGYVDFVADDDPRKQGLYMPGSRLPILASGQLVERDIGLCLMTVRPEIEELVVRKNQAFTARGGRLASIFPESPYALQAA